MVVSDHRSAGRFGKLADSLQTGATALEFFVSVSTSAKMGLAGAKRLQGEPGAQRHAHGS